MELGRQLLAATLMVVVMILTHALGVVGIYRLLRVRVTKSDAAGVGSVRMLC
jgi:hypothetical protein